MTCFGQWHLGRSDRVPFLSPGLKGPWVFPLPFCTSAFALRRTCPGQFTGARRMRGDKWSRTTPAAEAYGIAGLAVPQTHKGEINVFVLSLWDVEILQYAALL